MAGHQLFMVDETGDAMDGTSYPMYGPVLIEDPKRAEWILRQNPGLMQDALTENNPSWFRRLFEAFVDVLTGEPK